MKETVSLVTIYLIFNIYSAGRSAKCNKLKRLEFERKMKIFVDDDLMSECW